MAIWFGLIACSYFCNFVKNLNLQPLWSIRNNHYKHWKETQWLSFLCWRRLLQGHGQWADRRRGWRHLQLRFLFKNISSKIHQKTVNHTFYLILLQSCFDTLQAFVICHQKIIRQVWVLDCSEIRLKNTQEIVTKWTAHVMSEPSKGSSSRRLGLEYFLEKNLKFF